MQGLIGQSIDADRPLSDVQGYNASEVSMGGEDSVEKRLGGFVSKDSEYSQLARTQAKQSSEATGTLNSTMRDTAVTSGLINSALPVVQQDANTAASYKLSNQNATNKAYEFTASQGNTARNLRESGNQALDQIKESGSQTRQNDTNQGVINSRLQKENSQYALDQIKESGTQTRESDTNKGLINSRLQEEGYQQDLGKIEAQTNNDIILQNLKGDQAEVLTNLEARNAQLLQTSQSASVTYSNAMASIGDVLANQDIPSAQKQSLIDKQIQLLDSAMTTLGAIGNIDLSNILQSGTGGGSLSSGSVQTGSGSDAGQTPVNTGQFAAGVEGRSPTGESYFVPSGYNWTNFINKEGNEDLLNSFNSQNWTNSPDEWANRAWADSALSANDPRFLAEFGTSRGVNSGNQQAATPSASEQNALSTIDRYKSNDQQASGDVQATIVNDLKNAGYDFKAIVDLGMQEYPGTARADMEALIKKYF